MANTKNWSDEFKEYMEFIVNHPNYKGIPYTRKESGEVAWIAAKQSEVGAQRVAWALEKASQLGIKNEPGIFAKVMLQIHPTKTKPCQICGREMSLYYVYLNSNFAKKINTTFGTEFTTLDSLNDVCKFLLKNAVTEKDLILFLKEEFSLDKEYSDINSLQKDIEFLCRNGGSNKLGPGAMSNYPDRLDGFHTYNRCCRQTEDTGRHSENMKTYGKDRRAYEYWSDGNIHAANKFMTSIFFKGSSADHIGPISLGFKHDSLLLRKMKGGENSAKRDRLRKQDIEELILIEENNAPFLAISWFSENIWNFIKENYEKYSDLTTLRNLLKQNIANYLEILWEIKTTCAPTGADFLFKYFIKPKLKDFEFTYSFDDLGVITGKTMRRMTDATRKEIDRYVRISMASLDDYKGKDNRNLKPDLKPKEKETLNNVVKLICKNKDNQAISELTALIADIENRLINEKS